MWLSTQALRALHQVDLCHGQLSCDSIMIRECDASPVLRVSLSTCQPSLVEERGASGISTRTCPSRPLTMSNVCQPTSVTTDIYDFGHALYKALTGADVVSLPRSGFTALSEPFSSVIRQLVCLCFSFGNHASGGQLVV